MFLCIKFVTYVQSSPLKVFCASSGNIVQNTLVAETKVPRKAKGTKAKISLKKVKGATGYVVKISTSKKFKKKTTITKNVKLTTFTLKKLKKNKKYYIKVRAVRKTGKTKVYGLWSKPKRI